MRYHESHFTDARAIASYATDTWRKVPCLADLHRMATMLLAEGAQAQARMLVVGAGGGLELMAMAAAQPGWRFTGVDPSLAMLDLAREAVAPFAERVQFVNGTVDQASEELFDGATCLLTLHFLERSERLKTLQEIHRRLRSGARMVVAQHASPGGDAERWLARSVAFGAGENQDLAKASATGRLMSQRLPLLTPLEEEELLRAAGFVDVELFFAAFSFRGWVATAV